MRFFSSRKIDSDASFMDTSTNNKSMVQSIRSRFYGKSKGKEREAISPPVVTSPQSPGTQRSGDKPVPVRVKPQGAAVLRKDRPFAGPSPNSNDTKPSLKNPPSFSQPSTDPMTATLAQRLNELATSNSEGLLNDEEYRLLRQNLFERFASGAVVPSETPVVPLTRSPRKSGEGRPSMSASTQGRPSSQFLIDPTRAPSLHKKPSMTSTVSTIFRRASRRQSASALKDTSTSDASSIFSISSSTSNAFRRVLPRSLSRKGSDASIRTELSRTPYDTSRPGTNATDQRLSPTESMSRSTTRSLRRLATATPPSSFPARISAAETVGPGFKPVSSMNMPDVFDDGNLRTARDIRHEIGVVEAEGRRLMDAFNGLELSALTRRRNQPSRLQSVVSPSSEGSRSHNGDGSNWTLTPDRKRRGADVDALSIRSNTSVGTTLSAAKSQHSKRTPAPNKSVSLLRKTSFSSVSSSSRGNSSHGLPPVPPLPGTSSNLGQLGVGSSSSVNLARSTGHLPLLALAESEIIDRRSFAEARPDTGTDQEDVEIIALETELADIRKRRGEVTARYETRLEYLRAKLKGAELHEKLLRK